MIDDYCTGLQALLYLKSLDLPGGWSGQSAPTPKHQLGKPVKLTNTGLPSFGTYLVDKKVKEAMMNGGQKSPPTGHSSGPFKQVRPVPKVNELIGVATDRVGNWLVSQLLFR